VETSLRRHTATHLRAVIQESKELRMLASTESLLAELNDLHDHVRRALERGERAANDDLVVRAVSHDTVDRVVTIAVVCGTPFTPPTPTPTHTPAPTPTSTLTPTPWPTPALPTLVPAPWVVISAPAGPLTTFTEVAPPGQQVHLSGSGSSYVTRFQWSDSINGGAEVPLGVGPDLDLVLPLASTANCAITDHQIWLAGSTSDGQVARYMTDVKLEATCVR
jgi:hypothetical protein